MERVKPTIPPLHFILIFILGIFLSGCVTENMLPQKENTVTNVSDTAISIALNDSRLRTYLAYDGSYTIVYACPTSFESDNTIHEVICVDIETPDDLYHVYVNVTNNTVDHIWSQPKRSPRQG